MPVLALDHIGPASHPAISNYKQHFSHVNSRGNFTCRNWRVLYAAVEWKPFKAQILISHSSRDEPQALAIAAWLKENGWSDYFLDLEPERGIVAGERWENALHASAKRC